MGLFDRVPDESFMSCAENDHFGFSLEGRKTYFFLLAVDVSMYNSGLNDFVKT